MHATDAVMPKWALILGASSGFGAAASRALARAGFNIVGVHLDRRATLANAESVAAYVESVGRKALFFNVNAADSDRRAERVRHGRIRGSTHDGQGHPGGVVSQPPL